jgi:hypothetical protein
MTQVFGGSWRKNAKGMPCMAHHLLPLPIWVDGSERRLQAMQKRSMWGRLNFNKFLRRTIECKINLPPSICWAGQDRVHRRVWACCVQRFDGQIKPSGTRWVHSQWLLLEIIISCPATIYGCTLRKCIWFCFSWKCLVSRSYLFQDSDMSSYVGFHCYKISSLFEDLTNMNKTLSISVGLNSHAGNGQDTPRHTHAICTSSPKHNTTTHTGNLSLLVRRHGKLGRRSKQRFAIINQKGRYWPPQFGWKLLVWEYSSSFPRLQRGRDCQSKAERHCTTSQKLRNYISMGLWVEGKSDMQ